jgi:hypothetical protein
LKYGEIACWMQNRWTMYSGKTQKGKGDATL